MATRHELIHIDFVANAGKANPVLKSLQVSCNDARIAKEQLDAQLKDAKAMNAPAEVITNLEKKLKAQTTSWQQLERGVREYTKGIDTLSKGIKEFNAGTLDEMSAKFNKAVYNSAKLAQSAVKTGSSDWNQLQRLMDATDRNVTRAREDIDLMMKSIKDGSAVSTVQLTRSREVLEDLARLAVANSEEWRGLRKQFNEVDAAIASVTETEKRLKGEIATEADAIALSNHLTKESIALRHADGEAAMKATQAERKGVEETMRGISDRIVLLTKERDGVEEEIELQENLNDIIKERNEKILSAENRKQDAEQRKAQAQAIIKEYDEQEQKVSKLKQEKKELEEQQKKETKEAEKSTKAAEEQNKKQEQLTQTVATLNGEIGGLNTKLQSLEEQIKKTNAEPIKPKVDTSKIEELQAKLKAVQDGIADKNAQIEAQSKNGGAVSQWQEILTRVQGSKDGRLNPLGLGDGKKQMDDMLDVANNFYEIIKKVKGVTEDKFIPTQAAEPIKQLAEYYKITEEKARELVRTLQRSEVVNKKFGTLDYNELTGFVAIQKNKGKDDQQVRIEAAQSYIETARRSESNQTEKVNKLLAEKKKLEEEELDIKGKLKAATEGVAEATGKSGNATEKKVTLTKKEQEEVKKLTNENQSLAGTIEALKKQLDSLPASQGKATDAAKKGAEAAKEEAEAMKMTAEEAKAALAKMTDVGTVKASKNGPLEASNMEGAQQALFGIFKGAGATVGNGNFTLTGQEQIRKAVKAFQDKFHIDDDKYAKELMIKLATGKNGGLIRQGVSDVDPITHKPLLQISRDEGAWKERLRQQQEYRDIMAGVTTATREQTAADKAQEEVVKSLREAYQNEKDALERRNEEYQKRLKRAESMSGPAKKENGTLTAKGVELEKAEEYRQKYVLKQQEKERKAWEEYQAAKNGNIDVEKSRQKIEEQIAALEGQKAKNAERLTQLQEKGTKATKEQNKADGESVATGKSMNELLQEKERITSRLTEKQAELKKAQEELAKMTKAETAAGKEQSSVTEELTKKTEEYNAETEKLANMKEGRNKARGAIRSADRSISNADDAIATLKSEPLPQRKTEAEMGAMKKRVAELTAEVEKETAAFNKNAQAITELNRKETQAAIEMAQSENVSIEKVKQSIELLQKKIQTEATDAETMKQRGEAINRLSERLTQMNAEVVKLSKPIADRLNTKDLGTLNETELQQAIDAAKQLLKTYKTGSDEAKELAANIVRAEQHLKQYGVEAARQAAREAEQLRLEKELATTMNKRLRDLKSLSADALAETRKYWEAQRNGAADGTTEFNKAEAALKKIDNLQKKRRVAELDTILGDPKKFGVSEVRQAVQEMEKLRDSVQKGIPAWQHYNKMVNDGKTYLDQLAKSEAAQRVNDQMSRLTSLSASGLQEVKKYWETMVAGSEKGSQELADYETELKKVVAEEQSRRKENLFGDAQKVFGNRSAMSETELRRAVEAAKEYQQTLMASGSLHQIYSRAIAETEEYLKQYSVEAERAKVKQEALDRQMRERMQELPKLSESAMAETKKYWEDMMRTQGLAEQKLSSYRIQLEKLIAEENRRKEVQAEEVIGNLGTSSDGEIRKAIQAFEQLRDAQAHGNDEWKYYNERVQEGKRYLDEWKQVDSVVKFEGQMAKLPQLSDAALQETKKFWETMVAGAEKGSAELAQYEAHLEKVKQEERERKQINDEMTVQRLDGNLKNQSEQEISEAIEAGKRLIKTYETASPEAEALAKKIADAEDHLKKYGLEAERTARKEAQAIADAAKKRKESDDTMKQQLTSGLTLTKEALKAQEQYWKRLIDDPKTAASSLVDYQQQLDQVKLLQQQMMQQEGSAALDFFRGDTSNASAEQIKDQAKALKLFRDSLPQKDNAALLIEIDSYLSKAGRTAKEASGELMNLGQALEIAGRAGKDGFSATEDEIRKAIASIEKAIEIDRELIRQHRRSGNVKMVEYNEEEIKEYEKALHGLNLELKNVGMSHERMQKILENPVNADNLDELRAAIKRAKAELNSMDGALGDNRDQYDDMAKSVKRAEQQLKVMEGQARGTASAFEKAWSRLKTYVGLYVGASVAMQKLTATMGDLMELSDKMGEVRKTTGFTADEVGRLTNELKKMDVRTSLTELMSMSASAGQLGLHTLEDVQGFAEAANKLMIALPEMGKEAATEMMRVAIATGEVDKIRKQMQDGIIDGSSATAVAMEKIASTIDRLRATSASAAPEITDFVKRVGAVGAQSGISIDQVAALGSTVSSLGMRIEMSATALSRMIPAIRNNAFELAKAIGVTPETIRNLFDTERGMEVILMILQRIKDSRMDADSIEQMLGMAGMKDIMKDLNQQGARAGIVFSGLSQNVEELRRQLGVASEAYEENTAIELEFQKMNETTAAKWERLKNRVEEFFVGDTAQRWLGSIIDVMRSFVNMLTGDNGISIALRSIIAYLILIRMNILSIAKGALKSLGGGLRNIGIMLGFIKGEMTKLQWSNIFTAAAAAIWMAVEAFSSLKQKTDAVTRSMSELESSVGVSTREVGNLFAKLNKLSQTQDEATKSANSLKEQEEKLKKELKELRDRLGEGAEKTEEYKKKQEELEVAHRKVTAAESEASNATNRRLGVIKDINDNYSKYLGYMLSEASTAETVASAHDLIVAALKEEMYWREKNNAFKTISEEHRERLDSYRKSSLEELESDDIDAMRQHQIMSAWQAELTKVQYDPRTGYTLTPGGKAYTTLDQAVDAMKERFNSVLVTNGGYYMVHVDAKQDRLENWWGESGFNDKGFEDWTRESLKVLQEASMLQSMSGKAAEQAHSNALARAQENTDALIAQVSGEGATTRQMAEAIVGIQKNLEKYGELPGKYTQFTDTSLKGIANVMLKDVPDDTKKAVIEEMERVSANGTSLNDTTNDGNPWGKPLEGESIDWKNMTAEQLVNRRKQMNQFVNSIQTDTDIQAVLKEDAALKKAIEDGMSSDMRTVIEWYNTERLKIQDELHARHLTNTGDWMDPKKQRARKKQFDDDLKAFLDELDAYYTERKTRIQEAGTDEGITEAEVRNRTLANEMEWRQRRAELQKLYADKSAEVVAAEQQAIYDIIAERTGDTSSFIEKSIKKTVDFSHKVRDMNDQGAKEYRGWMGKLGLGWERDFLKQQQAVSKQMQAIQDIIDKERPFNGITKNLRENLVTMGILTADMTKERNRLMQENADMTDFNARQAAEEVKRTAFMLGEAENAYVTTIEDVMRRMAEKGMQAWVDALKENPQMQEGLMAQLRSTYDAIQDAINKEASQLKKQAEIMWNNILLPDGKTTLKQQTDRAIAQLGLDEGRVKRANGLIGAGTASERVSDRLAIRQLQMQLAMQEHYYNLMRKQGLAHVEMLEAQAAAAKKRGDAEEATRKTLDAQHARMSLNLATAKEETELAKQREEIIARTEESQNLLYTSLREWADLLSSSVQSLFEASHAGEAEYYNELAKLNLTGRGGPGAGTYVVIDDAGTSDAKAHYESLSESGAIEREQEIERQNAMADAWRKVMDDLNAKMNEQITDWMNAALQNQSIDANTDATLQNTEAIAGLTNAISGSSATNDVGTMTAGTGAMVASGDGALSPAEVQEWTDALGTEPWLVWEQAGVSAMQHVQQATTDTSKKMATSTQSAFAKMTQAANLYGIAYSAMSNDNLSTTQKFEMMAVQAAGQAAISMLTADLAAGQAKNAVQLPGILGKLLGEMPYPAAIATFAIVSGLLGGLMGLAVSKITKSKSQIAQATGASGANAGRLATGMLTYASGNVNAFTDPSTLTPGRSYNVDAADGKTYRARYMGKGAKTHLTHGPEFHLVGEAGREAIIDAKTTRQIQMDDPGIWHTIQTLYNGGRISAVRRRRGRGMAAFADGNIDDFEDSVFDGSPVEETAVGMTPEQMAAFQSSLDRNNELLERALTEGIKAVNKWDGPDGIPNMYNRMEKEARRHGVKYL
ncbi:MAG: phage tail tape measure protein [Prevotella sp.]|nr:phage tail tape measure protein [Prevotella sp.]